jgi:hypothetical protein
MIHMRIHLSYTFSTAVAHAVTIAMRYSAIRFQGLNPQGYVRLCRSLVCAHPLVCLGMKLEC